VTYIGVVIDPEKIDRLSHRCEIAIGDQWRKITRNGVG
jgi:hypothetical protein